MLGAVPSGKLAFERGILLAASKNSASQDFAYRLEFLLSNVWLCQPDAGCNSRHRTPPLLCLRNRVVTGMAHHAVAGNYRPDGAD